MRLKYAIISSQMLLDLLRNGWDGKVEVMADPVPKDAVIIHATNTERGDLHVTIRSDEFPDVRSGEPIPELKPVFRTIETKPRTIETKAE